MFNCYGPQEVNQSQRSTAEQHQIVNSFWIELEKEVIKAKDEDVMVVIQMDANQTCKNARPTRPRVAEIS